MNHVTLAETGLSRNRLVLCFGRYVGSVCLLALCVSQAAQAVMLTVTPSAITNLYRGTITVEIAGELTSGETVILEKFFDFNDNGALDPEDQRSLYLTLTDGVQTEIGGVTATYWQGDADGLVNGSIQWVQQLWYYDLPQVVSPYLFRVSSPASRFEPAVGAFRVSNSTLPQHISGTVRCNGTIVPHASAVLLLPEPDGRFAGAAVADASGHYDITMPPGSYTLVPFRSGFVADMANALRVDLIPGTHVQQDLELLAATRSLSGKAHELGAPAAGLATVMVMPISEDGLLGWGFTEPNGRFDLAVAAGRWRLNFSDPHLGERGYLVERDELASWWDTTDGDVADALVPLAKATSLVYGTLRDSEGEPLSGIYVEIENDTYRGTVYTDGAGDYQIGALDGFWSVCPSDEQLAALGLGRECRQVSVAAGQATQADLAAPSLECTVRGTVRQFDTLAPVPGVGVGLWDAGDFTTITDAEGRFEFQVFVGSYRMGLTRQDAYERRLLGQHLNLSVANPGSLIETDYYVRPSNSPEVSVNVLGNAGPMSGVLVWGTVFLDGMHWESFPHTDNITSPYQLQVCEGKGQWLFGLHCENGWVMCESGVPCPPGYPCPPSLEGVPADRTHWFFLAERPLLTLLSSPGETPLRLEFNAVPGLNHLEVSTDLAHWIPVLSTSEVGRVPFDDSTVGARPHRFFRVRVEP